MLARARSKLRTGRMFAHTLGPAEALLYLLRRRRLRTAPAGGRPLRLRSRHARHALLCRPGTSDLGVFNQVFVQGQYRCFDDLHDAGLIIDAGANVGYASAYFLSRFPRARLIAVEPDPGNFTMLEANLRPYGDRQRALRSALWSHPAGLVISEERFRDGREWTRQVRPAGPHEPPTLRAVSVEGLLAEAGCERVTILKIDIERAETVVFGAGNLPWLDRVDNIAIELHDDECRSVFTRALAGRGFAHSEWEELTVSRRAASPGLTAPGVISR